MSINNILSQAVADDEPKGNEMPNEDIIAAEAGLEAFSEAEALFEVEKDLSDLENAMELTDTAIAGLESMEDVLVASQENGGLSAADAMMLNVAVGSVMAPFGGYTAKPMPSNEAFDEDGGRAASTVAANEAIKETMVKMWDAVAKFIKDMIAKVQIWFNNNMGSIKRLGSSADALAQKAATAKGTPKEAKLSVSMPEYIYDVDGEFYGTPANVEAFATAAKTLESNIEADSNALDAATEGAAGLTEEMIKGMSVEDVEKESMVLGKALADQMSEDLSDNKAYKKEGFVVKSGVSKLTPSGARAVIMYPADKDEPAITDIDVKWTGVVVDAKAHKDASEDALNSDEVVKAASAIKAASDLLVKATEARLKAKSKADAYAKQVAKNLKMVDEAVEDSAAKAMLKATVKEVSKLSTFNVSLGQKYIAAAGKVLSAQYSFAKASYKNLEEAK